MKTPEELRTTLVFHGQSGPGIVMPRSPHSREFDKYVEFRTKFVEAMSMFHLVNFRLPVMAPAHQETVAKTRAKGIAAEVHSW